MDSLNPSALLLPADRLITVVEWLKLSRNYLCDTLSNVTGVDYLPTEKKSERKLDDGSVETLVETISGYIEVVYHFYSIELNRGPLVLKVRTDGREQPSIPSLFHHYRSVDLQEREIYDLFGVVFEGHPDLRRLLMWEGFEDYPMRKDYRPPNDNEYEPIASRHLDTKSK